MQFCYRVLFTDSVMEARRIVISAAVIFYYFHKVLRSLCFSLRVSACVAPSIFSPDHFLIRKNSICAAAVRQFKSASSCNLIKARRCKHRGCANVDATCFLFRFRHRWQTDEYQPNIRKVETSQKVETSRGAVKRR